MKFLIICVLLSDAYLLLCSQVYRAPKLVACQFMQEFHEERAKTIENFSNIEEQQRKALEFFLKNLHGQITCFYKDNRALHDDYDHDTKVTDPYALASYLELEYLQLQEVCRVQRAWIEFEQEDMLLELLMEENEQQEMALRVMLAATDRLKRLGARNSLPQVSEL